MSSKAELIAELERVRAENALLSQDTAYGGLTRPGVEIEHRKRARECTYAVYVDLNNIHNLNKTHGEPVVNEMIRGAFSFTIRDGDVVVFGRWRSGDEEVFLIKGDPEGFIARLYENLHANGLSGIAAYRQIEGDDLVGAVESAADEVRDAKILRGMESR